MDKNLEQRVIELEKEVATLKGEKVKSKLKGLKVGDSFELIGIEWTILDITDSGYVCLAERLEEDMKFDKSCNNWNGSDLRNYLNVDFYKKLSGAIGEDNIIEFERDLLSLDGLDEYGTCTDKVSIISFDEYRKYRNLIPNAGYWWWTLTPDTTKGNGNSTWVAVVSPSGFIDFNNYGSSYDYNDGVRPFCIFSSAIFESEE